MHFFDKKHSFQEKEKSNNNKQSKHNSHSTFLKKVLGRVLDGGQDQNQTNLLHVHICCYECKWNLIFIEEGDLDE